MSTSFYNQKDLEQTRRNLRKTSTPAELALWQYLRNGKLAGRKFRRQYSVGRFIIDFYCPPERLAIELDGQVHQADKIYNNDLEKEKFLLSQNIKLLRFENHFIFDQLDFVLNLIIEQFKK